MHLTHSQAFLLSRTLATTGLKAQLVSPVVEKFGLLQTGYRLGHGG